jgi:phosphoglycerate-specific signal transduction histidine kinase
MMASSGQQSDYLDTINELSSQIKSVVEELKSGESFIDHASFGQRDAFFPHSLFSRITESLLVEQRMVSEMELDIPQNLPTKLLGEELNIKRIIVGLAINACKFYEEPHLAVSLAV